MNLPKIIYISGKTCTGKTTLSRKLSKEYGYPIVELDSVIDELQPEKDYVYIEAYQGDISSTIVQSFIKASISALQTAVDSHGGVIFEGAIANPEILESIIKPWTISYKFIYLHPINIDSYVKQVVSRFKKSTVKNRNGLPSLFWNEFSHKQLETYYEKREIDKSIISSIESYAKISMNESSKRLKKFSEFFNDIDIKEI